MNYKPSITRLACIALLTIATSISLQAQQLADKADVPRTISYQGLLTSSDGRPFADGQYEITVTLYSDGRGDSPVWQDNYLAEVTGGVFNVLIGSGSTALPSSENLSTPLWIGTSVNGAPEMRPLTPMTASPYALNVPDRAITTNKLAEKSVTAEKVDMDYISGLEIDGMPVSGKGAVLKLKSSEKIALTYDEVTQTVLIDEASQASVTTGDEKDAKSLVGAPVLWSDGGDTYTVPMGTATTPGPGSWIGPKGNVPFDLRTWSTSVMRYHTPAIGTDPNVEGGQGSIVSGTSVGSTIAGGGANVINNNYNSIGGGQANRIQDGNYNVVSGGHLNNIFSNDINTIGGGANNNIGASGSITFPRAATIAGGEANLIMESSAGGTIGGGSSNQVTDFADHSVIAGGQGNQITREYGTISGGFDNFIDDTSPSGTIGGGATNLIGGGSIYATIGGGIGNSEANAPYSTIGGGQSNAAVGAFTTIPGGDQLSTANSYAQVVVGFYNDPRGSMPTQPTAAQIAASNDPLFMVGNGDVNAALPSNAFEVSYNGHTAVYGVNGQVNPSIAGGTFVDNVVYAWGHYDPFAAVPRVSDFGIATVLPVGVGVWDVRINTADQTGAASALARASVTVTVVDDASGGNSCTFVTTTPLGAVGPQMFRVRTTRLVGSTCTPVNVPFMFKVTGRP